MKRQPVFRTLALAAIALALPALGSAAGIGKLRFIVVDPLTRLPVPGWVTLTDPTGRTINLLSEGKTQAFDTLAWLPTLPNYQLTFRPADDVTTVTIPLGTTVTLHQTDQVPVKEITIRVTATRLVANRAPAPTSGTSRTKEQIQKFVNTTQTDTRQLTKGQAGIAEDSAGQQHVRGEHTDITYVVDGVPLPDTLSGRQGAIVVPSTIQNLEIITGGFAAEYGGQTAAILNIATISSITKQTEDLSIQGGSYRTFSGDFASQGPLGKKANYVVDLNANRTDNQIEPQQPDNQTAHNAGESRSAFTKLHFTPNSNDAYTLTLSENPDSSQIGNRTGLPNSFAGAGEGYGFLGLRNADGSRPDVNSSNSNLLGAQKMLLPNQQQAGMDINQTEVNEFAVLNMTHRFGKHDSAQLAATILHSGQNLTNGNPSANVMDLPVDNSIEYNPTAYRNIHHLQLTGSYEMERGPHKFKLGFVTDQQSGNESYHVVPASQLALDALAALDPALAPIGSSNPNILDINGNPVYTATSSFSPTLEVSRTGYYDALYAQDTWTTGHLTANYGLRFDLYHQHESISTEDVNAKTLSPRLNFEYKLDKLDDLRWSYNRLFNTPPLAQGGIVGLPIQPEILSQYDIAFSRKLSAYQTVNLAYYYKDIRNQVDVGLLIPGSQIGLYSAVNLEFGGVHGVELSYNVSAPHGVGWDGYLSYSYSAAKPNGVDNTGEQVDEFNDHDQRQTLGIGAAYTWKSGLSVAGTFQYNSGLASSIVPPNTGRTPRSQLDIHATTGGDRLFRGHGGLELDVQNLFDSRQVINFQSAFSGTRFQSGRTFTLGAHFHF